MSLVQEAIRERKRAEAEAAKLSASMSPRAPQAGPAGMSPRKKQHEHWDRDKWLARVQRRREAEFVQKEVRRYLGTGKFIHPKYWCPDMDKLPYGTCKTEVDRIKAEHEKSLPNTKNGATGIRAIDIRNGVACRPPPYWR